MATITITGDEFEQISQLLREAQTFWEASKSEYLSLAQKLEYRRHANSLAEQACKIGRNGR